MMLTPGTWEFSYIRSYKTKRPSVTAMMISLAGLEVRIKLKFQSFSTNNINYSSRKQTNTLSW